MKAYICLLTALLMPPLALVGGQKQVRLRLEHTTVLYVGQTAILQLPKGSALDGTAGTVLTIVKCTHGNGSVACLYRAVRPGREVILIRFAAVAAKGHCESCAQYHYFIKVKTPPRR